MRREWRGLARLALSPRGTRQLCRQPHRCQAVQPLQRSLLEALWEKSVLIPIGGRRPRLARRFAIDRCALDRSLRTFDVSDGDPKFRELEPDSRAGHAIVQCRRRGPTRPGESRRTCRIRSAPASGPSARRHSVPTAAARGIAEHRGAVPVKAQDFGQRCDGLGTLAVHAGNAVPISATPPMFALCELRPVSSATRVGEQTGAVCMLL